MAAEAETATAHAVAGLEGFTANVLRFVAEVRTPVALGPWKGSALRGALFEALRGEFCTDRASAACRQCDRHRECAVSFLLAPVDDEARRGHEAPRPYVIKPPTDQRVAYGPGETLEFRVVLFARALKLFPYLIVAAQRMAEQGIGRGRGRLALREVWAEHPILGRQERVMHAGERLVKVPDLPVTARDIAQRAGQWPEGKLTLCLRTPLRLVSGEQLVTRPSFPTLIRRLLERLSALSEAYAGERPDWHYAGLLAIAEQVTVARDATRWLDLERYSGRQGHRLPMGGAVGEVSFAGDWRLFRELLAWAELAHVGKYAVMGNGWIEVQAGVG